MHIVLYVDFSSHFGRCLTQLRPSETPKIIDFPLVFVRFSYIRPSEVNIDLGADLGANLAPFWLQKPTKIHPKLHPKCHLNFDQFGHRFFSRFGVDLGSILSSEMHPRWDPRGSNEPRFATLLLSWAALGAKMAPRPLPRVSGTTPKP